jgi:hypothetical protein
METKTRQVKEAVRATNRLFGAFDRASDATLSR